MRCIKTLFSFFFRNTYKTKTKFLRKVNIINNFDGSYILIFFKKLKKESDKISKTKLLLNLKLFKLMN